MNIVSMNERKELLCVCVCVCVDGRYIANNINVYHEETQKSEINKKRSYLIQEKCGIIED